MSHEEKAKAAKHNTAFAAELKREDQSTTIPAPEEHHSCFSTAVRPKGDEETPKDMKSPPPVLAPGRHALDMTDGREEHDKYSNIHSNTNMQQHGFSHDSKQHADQALSSQQFYYNQQANGGQASFNGQNVVDGQQASLSGLRDNDAPHLKQAP